MKKNYQEPSTKVEYIDIEQPLLMGSVESSIGDEATMPAKSRDFGLFGDDGDITNINELIDNSAGF